MKRRGAAVGLAFGGVGFGGFVVLPATEAFIQWTNWRRTMQALAVLLAALLIPVLVRLLRETLRRMGLQPDGAAPPTAA